MDSDTIEIGNGIEIGSAGEKGLGLFATRKLSPRDIIHSIDQPALIAISTSKLPDFCYNCYAGSEPVTGNAYSLGQRQGAHLKVCTGCQMAHFCGKACQVNAWKSFHKYECKKFALWKSRLGKPFDESARAMMRFILQHCNGSLPGGLWERVLSLESHAKEMRNLVDSKAMIMIKTSAEAIKAYTGTDLELASVIRLSLVLKLNAMVLTTTCGEEIGVFLDPVLSRMNHSCDGGNVVIHRPVHTNYTGWSLQTIPVRPMIIIFPVREIAEDEELTATYDDRKHYVVERREILADRFNFVCDCEKCERELKAWTTVKHENPGLFHDSIDWFREYEKQTNLLEAVESSPQTIQSAVASLEGLLEAMKSKPEFNVGWFPYPQAVNELRLASTRRLGRFDLALLYALQEYFVIWPVVYPFPLDLWRVVPTLVLVGLLRTIADTYYEADLDTEILKQREAIERKGFSQTSFTYWFLRISEDMRTVLLQSAATDLAEVFLKEQMSVGIPLDVAEKILRDAQVKARADKEMRNLLNITKAKWDQITKK